MIGEEFIAFLTAYEHVRYHEAGHAVVAFLMGRRLTGVTAFTEEDVAAGRAGMTHYSPVRLTLRSRPSTVEKSIRMALAGGIAERIGCPGAPSGDESDVADAKRYAEWYLHPSYGEVERLRVETEELLRRHWPAVEAVADELFGRGGEPEWCRAALREYGPRCGEVKAAQ